ncbi:MAG: aminoacyl-tRNA hydrolase, partial [Candidatus Nealsonbacteria bacterium CG10_big_fil_rev_8_21_14_0_10_36_228]
MILIVGLGNPGKKFQKTRHNIGFRIVDEFTRKNNFPKFKLSKKFNAEISEGILGGEKILLAKPQTFMNLSGK